MKDFKQVISALDQRASGTIQITDYTKLVGVKAQATITVVDYTKLVGVKAQALVTIVDYTQLALKTVTVNGTVLTEGTDWHAATSNNATATSLASAIDGVSNIDATASLAVVTVKAAAVGVAGNAYTLATNATIGGLTLGSATLAGGVDQGTITINATTLTQGSDFNAVTDNATTATNIAAAIDGVTNIDSTAALSVVTVKAAAVGVAGNAYTMATNKSPAGVTLSAATLSGGVDQGQIVVGVNTIVQGSDFNAVTDNNTTATNIATKISTLSGYIATATLDTVTLFYTAPGTTGNSKALTTNAPTGVTLSAATLLGGVAASYSQVFDISNVGYVSQLTALVSLNALAGSSTPKATVTPEWSLDKVNFTDFAKADASAYFSDFTAINTPQRMDATNDISPFYRFKIVLAGINTIADVLIEAVAAAEVE